MKAEMQILRFYLVIGTADILQNTVHTKFKKGRKQEKIIKICYITQM